MKKWTNKLLFLFLCINIGLVVISLLMVKKESQNLSEEDLREHQHQSNYEFKWDYTPP